MARTKKDRHDENGGMILDANTYRRSKIGIDYCVPAKSEAQTIFANSATCLSRAYGRNLGGRPPRFNTIQELEDGILSYFQYIQDANENCEDGKAVTPDVAGLAIHLGVARQTLYDWERSNYKGFSDTIKKAKTAILANQIQLAARGAIPPLVLAMLANNDHGWTQNQKLVIEPHDPYRGQRSAEEIVAEYEALPD